jgi:preprotein translocase subunit SecD
MFASLRNRLIVIGLLVVFSVYYLVPRNQTVRERGSDGLMHEVLVKRVPLKLGLDLQGGMHLELGLDQTRVVAANPVEALNTALLVLRKRIDEFGVSERLIQKVGNDKIVVELPGIKDPARAEAVVERTAHLEFRLTEKTGALDNALPAMDRALAQLGVRTSALESSAATKGVEALLSGDTSRKTPADSAKKPAAGDSAAGAVTGHILQDLIKSGASVGIQAIPGEYVVPKAAHDRLDSLLQLPEVQRLIPRNLQLFWDQGPSLSVGAQQMDLLYALSDKPMATGSNLIDAAAQIDPMSNRPIVTFELDRPGGRRFGEETGKHVGDYMAIVLDDRVQGRPPVIQSRIDRRGQIELGSQTLQQAQDLALTLKAGALPVPLRIEARREVGASLGADSIKDGMKAGIVGTILVILIMVGYYRMAGLLAVAALGLYLLFTLAGLSAMEATLTLPGIAGIALSVGIAVDANVLIFERIREELIAGRTVRLAVDEGFKHAMNAIIDSNVSTVITALFLFQFGTGPVKGFAVTLIMGIAASLVTAVFVTRTFFMIWLERKPSATTLSI